jgi:hypothetical protein
MEQTNSELLLERLNSFIEMNKEEHADIKAMLKEWSTDHEDRIRKLEDWKLVFVAKYSVYSGLALFFGSVISTIAFDIIKGYMK